jgi:hypothetical protein
MFKGFKFGKGKKKSDKAEDVPEDLIEEEAAAEESQEQSDDDNTETRPGPHGPLEELSVDPEEDLDDVDLEAEIADGAVPEDGAEGINLVEIKAEGAPPAGATSPPPDADAAALSEDKKEPEPKALDDSFDSLFADEEEEDNPLASLIDSLPEVSASEILSDIAEIREIMREGH